MFRLTRSRLVEVIQRALALIAVQETWTRGTLARDAQGAPVSPFAPEAVRFCANAAFQIMQGNECAALQLARAVEFEIFAMGMGLESVNDGGGREAVLALLRKELASATARLAEHRSRALFNVFPPPPPGELEQSAAPATTALATELLI